MIWIAKHPQAHPDMLGYLPELVSDQDPRPAREQFHANYTHGGGWQPFKGHTMLANGNLAYPDDPPTHLLFETKLRDETIRFYDGAWVCVIQKDGTYEIARMD